MRAVDGRRFGGVKPLGRYLGCIGAAVAFTIALATLWPADVALGQEAAPGVARPAPNVQRQVDRLGRSGSVDPLTRRSLEDLLRRQPRGADRSAAERTLDRLPSAEPMPLEPLPEPRAGDPLPSSLTPGRLGGPGTRGHMVPPGGRSGAVR